MLKIDTIIKPLYEAYPDYDVIDLVELERLENRLRTEADWVASAIRRRKYPSFIGMQFPPSR